MNDAIRTQVEELIQALEQGRSIRFEGHWFQWDKVLGGFDGSNPYGQPCFGGSDARALVESLAAGETYGRLAE